MVNKQEDKRGITAGRNLIEANAVCINIIIEENEAVSNNEKVKAENNQQKLTIEELRSCKGCETVSESEGQEIIESLF